MPTRTWISTLLLIAAVALLPAWLVGSAALGAALGLWVATKLVRPREERAAASLPPNVIVLRRHA